MSNYIELDDKIAFHPGYYIEELVKDSGLTQRDFANRLGTTPKNLSLLIRGKQNLSIDIAMKLSRLYGTSISYWLNMQKSYDMLIAESKSNEELAEERKVFANLKYSYFTDHYHLPDLPGKIDEQIDRVRSFLNVATLTVLNKRDMAVSFRSTSQELREANIIKANTMVQIATNIALRTDVPKFDKIEFEKAVAYALTLTKERASFYPLIREAFLKAGVVFVILPNIDGSEINGATKKVGNSIMLMVNDRRLNSDSFWFTLFHEIGHIMNGDYGVSFDSENGEPEKIADEYAENMLIPPDKYRAFVAERKFNIKSICDFAENIGRDAGIVLGRLLNDKIIDYQDQSLNVLRHQYKVTPV